LLDIKVKEPSRENILKGINKPEKPRFMSVNKALDILLRLEKNGKKEILSEETFAIGIARLGSDSQTIKYGKIKDLINFDFGKPLHSLIIPGKTHFIEEDMMKLWE
jgi:diphthine synthase